MAGTDEGPIRFVSNVSDTRVDRTYVRSHCYRRTMAQLRWTTTDRTSQEALFDDVVERHIGRGRYEGLEFLHVEARSVINRIPFPGRFPFEYTINAYRGCSHACVYCFARPTHDYLGLSIGSDFDSKIVVKINAPEIVRHETEPRRWARHPIAMGTNTDPYQSAEGKYRLTRQIIEVLAERKNPFSVLTKSPLVLRDLDVLTEAAAVTEVTVDFSIGTVDEGVWKLSEPGTPHPRKRLDAVARLTEAGIRSGVLMAPILPGLSDDPEQLEAVVEGAVSAGARFIAGMYLHLRGPLKGHYLDWLAAARPELVRRHAGAYANSAYAPTDAQQHLSDLIRSLVEKHGGPTSDRTWSPRENAAAVSQAEQLTLRI